MLFSTLTSTTLAAVLTVGVVLVGRFADVIRGMREVAPGVPQLLVSALFAIVPNFSNFDFKARVAYGDAVPADVLGWTTLYALAWIVVVLGLGLASFRTPGLPVSLRLALVLALVGPLVPLSQQRIEGLTGRFRAQEEVLYLWSGEHVRRLVPGFESLAADVYWLRTVQYFGGQRVFARDKRFELLRPLIDITTTLDPRFEIAYRYGAIYLSEPPPLGAGRPHEGIEVLEAGARALPASWRLPPGPRLLPLPVPGRRPDRCEDPARGLADSGRRLLAADAGGRSAGQGGDRESSRRMWRQMYDQAEEGIIRDNARVRLQILDSLDARDALAAAVAEFVRRHARRPTQLEEVVADGLWRGPLHDAAGVPFGYDADTGAVDIQQASPMWRPQ